MSEDSLDRMLAGLPDAQPQLTTEDKNAERIAKLLETRDRTGFAFCFSVPAAEGSQDRAVILRSPVESIEDDKPVYLIVTKQGVRRLLGMQSSENPGELIEEAAADPKARFSEIPVSSGAPGETSRAGVFQSISFWKPGERSAGIRGFRVAPLPEGIDQDVACETAVRYSIAAAQKAQVTGEGPTSA